MFYHCKNESRKLEVCGCEYFRIQANSRTVSLNLQDQNHFPGLSRSWKFYKRYSRTSGEAWEHW